jgi:hypothetical protein
VPFVAFFPDIALDKTHLPTDQTYLFRAPTAGPRNPWLNDLSTQNLPWTEKVRLTWRAGGLPLRDRWNGCGTPLAGNGPAGAFSPLTLLAVALPIPRAFGLAAAWKLLAALAGMWLWLRELRVSGPAALFGAVSFGFSGSIVPWILFPIAAAVAAWPWVFFGVERLRDEEGRPRTLVFLVATLAVWPLLGHIESVVSGVALLAVLLLTRWASGDLPDAPRVMKSAVLAGLAGAGLTAFALIPETFAILGSNRRVLASVPFYAPHFSVLPHGFSWPLWRATVFPNAFGNGIDKPMLANTAAFPEMALGYFGLAGWAAALLVLRPGSRRAGATAGLIAAIVLALCVSYGGWPFAEIEGRVPLLNLMFPLRFLSWVALAGSALAALELDRWCRDSESAPRRTVLFAVLTALALALLVLDTEHRYRTALGTAPGLAGGMDSLRLALSCAAAFALASLLALARSAAVRRALPYVLLPITAAELVLQGARLYEIGPSAAVFAGSPLSLFLRSRPAPSRVVGEGVEFFPASNVFANVEDVRTHDPTERRDYVEFLDATCGYPPAAYFKRISNLDAPALDFLNVRYLVSRKWRAAPGRKWRAVYGDSDGTVFENAGALPRVFAPIWVAGVPGTPPPGRIENANRHFRSVWPQISQLADFRARAFVLGERSGERRNSQAEITDYVETGRRAAFRSRAAGETVLVASLVQDGGWNARDESGERLPTSLANGPFLTVTVPAGDHRVFLVYTPPGWRVGLAVSLATAALLAGTALRKRR